MNILISLVHLLKIIFVFGFLAAEDTGQDLTIISVGHSHNDYAREVPLYDALKYGFTSIEVDVYWHDGRMVVTHDADQLNEKPTLQALYLDPLKSVIQKNGGTVFPDSKQKLVLMIDLKSDKVETYHALNEIFAEYRDMIEWYQGDDKIDGAIQILLSGGPPIDLIEKEDVRYFFVDGAINQWSMHYPASLMPRASTNYRSHFTWIGEGSMPAAEEEKLRQMVKTAHDSGRKIRFWASPDNIAVWKKLLDEGADWINVDDLQGFNQFYRNLRD